MNKYKKIMIGIFVALAVLLGVGGTVAVADNARPGDALFGIDKAVESVRISFAGDDKKNELRIRFAEERVEEIEDLVDDEDASDDAIDGENDNITAEERAKVNVGIEAALNLLINLKEQQGEDPRLDDVINRLNAFIADLPSNARIEVDDDKLKIKFEDNESKDDEDGDSDKSKIKIRTDEGRIKIEVKNGVLEIKTKLDDSSDGLEEAEAEILSDKTIVKVEFNDEETTFTTSATAREAIIAAIIAKFPGLTTAQVDAALEIETEDDDEGEEDDDSDDEKDEDDDDSDNDSDEDEDNSGSNSGSGSN